MHYVNGDALKRRRHTAAMATVMQYDDGDGVRDALRRRRRNTVTKRLSAAHKGDGDGDSLW